MRQGWLVFTLLTLLIAWFGPTAVAQDSRPPNVIFILADDLGYGELGCYGQEKIRTPHLDALATNGIRFTDAYTGAPVCAPARCVLMTGVSPANAQVRGNKEVGGWGPDEPEGQWPITEQTTTVAELMKQAGYATGAMGKWGLGGPGSQGHPSYQGFDLFYGYLCQRVAHNFYPTHLWHNHDVDILDGNRYFRAHQKIESAEEGFDQFYGEVYAADKMLEQALGFIRKHKDQPFFLYLPFLEPHVAMQPPQQWVDRYPEAWDDKPYLGQRGYLPHPRPRAGYAAMISDLDEHVGAVVKLIDALGLGENTLIVFTSDNGPTHNVGGVETEFFRSAGPLRGRKGSVYEGGIRVPMIARWAGQIEPGRVTHHQVCMQDLMATLAELTGEDLPAGCDGISYLPTLTGEGEQQRHAYLAWEFYGYGGQKAVRFGDWKAVQTNVHRGNTAIQLYNLSEDLGETTNLADQHPDLIEKASEIFANDRTRNANFPMRLYDEQ
ncbi:MAG: arylsulfatase [Planctomycetota bacterium]